MLAARHACSQLRSSKVMHCFLVSALRLQSPFHSLFSAMFFAFLGFVLVILLFKVASKHSAEVLPSFLKCEKACRENNVCQLSFVQACVRVLLAMSQMLKNQQYILKKVSLNKDSYKSRSCVDELMKMHDQRHVGTQPCISCQFSIASTVKD